MSYPILDADRTAERLPYGALADAIEQVLRDRQAGALRLAERTVLPLKDGTLLTMPASDDRLTITKLVTVHPGNAAKGLPTIQGEMMVARADDGTRLGLLHGATVTMRRTAALSVVALRALRLGREEAVSRGPLLVFGAGDQARAHAEAFTAEFGIPRVRIVSRTRERAERLAARLRERGVAAEVVATMDPAASDEPLPDEVARAVAEAPVIVTATTSRSPVLRGATRHDGVIVAVGAYRHDMAELSPGTIRDAAVVVVDTLEGARAEAGDLIQAVEAGVWSWGRARTLLDVLDAPPTLAGVRIFKSVGHAMYDLAAARVAFARV